MSHENVAIVRGAFAAFNRRDLVGAAAVFEADAEWVPVIEVEFRGMGKASGADIRTTVVQAVSFRDRKVTRVQGFRSADDALEAVGLGE